MSAGCRRVGDVVRRRERTKTRISRRFRRHCDGTAVAYAVLVPATRHRDGCLPVFVLAGFFALALGIPGWPAMAGSHAGGHVGGFGGGARLGSGVPRGGEFGGGRFVGRRFGDHRFGHGHRGRGGFFPYVSAYPFYDEDDVDEGHVPHHSYNPYPNGGHCDVSHSYPQTCVWKDGL